MPPATCKTGCGARPSPLRARVRACLPACLQRGAVAQPCGWLQPPLHLLPERPPARAATGCIAAKEVEEWLSQLEDQRPGGGADAVQQLNAAWVAEVRRERETAAADAAGEGAAAPVA